MSREIDEKVSHYAKVPVLMITVLRNVVDSIQAINGQNADKIIGLTLFVCF